MFWFRQGLCFLPAFLVVWSSGTFIINYIIGVLRHDVDLVFPYISDTAANPPESCIFGLMTFISACAGTATIYARYKFVETVGNSLVRPWVNKLALSFGLMSCAGMCVVATFQETAVTPVHDLGAFLFFLSGVGYTIVQTIISFKSNPNGSASLVFRIQLVLAIISTLAMFPTVICAGFVKQTILHRHTYDKDYPFQMASAVCEWIVAFSFVLFFLTYIDDFKGFTLQVTAEVE